MGTDGRGNPLRFLLSSGNRNDICMAQTLLEPFDLRGKLILADKGYDSDQVSAGWKNEAGSWSFPAASTQGIPDLQTGIHTRSAILWRICSSSSKITAISPPDMRRRPSIFMLLPVLPIPLVGYFDGFQTGSRIFFGDPAGIRSPDPLLKSKGTCKHFSSYNVF